MDKYYCDYYIEDPLKDAFEELKEQASKVQQLMGPGRVIKKGTVPSLLGGPTPQQIASTLTRTEPIITSPLPAPIQARVETVPSNIADIPVAPEIEQLEELQVRRLRSGGIKSARGKAPPQAPPPPPPTTIPVPVSLVRNIASVTTTTTTPTSTTTTTTTTTTSSQQSSSYRFICQQEGCNYKSHRRQDYENHLNTHQGQKFYCQHKSCPISKKGVLSKKSLDAHTRKVHSGIDRCHCPIPGCTWSSNDYGKLPVHKFREHGLGNCDFRCPDIHCRHKKFDTVMGYNKHMATFHNSKDHQCPICLKWYKGRDNLQNHLAQSHKGEKLVCDICGKKYSTFDSLKSHKNQEHKD